jgi:integrase/recombinase XerD
MKTIHVDTASIDGHQRICLFFNYDEETIDQIKSIPGARWNPAMKCWHVSMSLHPIEKLNYRFYGKLEFIPKDNFSGVIETEAETKTGQPTVRIPDEFMKTLKLKHYSPKTIKTYATMLKLFMSFYKSRDIDDLSDEDVRDYLL